jgi:hypothetical protein
MSWPNQQTLFCGEVIFNTGMSGYHEILTDPPYTGQTVMMTYPHIGNYGDDDLWSEVGPETGRHSARGIKAGGLIVRSVYDGPVPAGRSTIDEFLKSNGVCGITEVDTRAIADIGLRQPDNRSAFTREDVAILARQIGFPVLLRPSFVLGGRSMVIAYGEEELDAFLSRGIPVGSERPVLVDQFLEDVYEYDVDAVSDRVSFYVGGILRHIEAAGIHSGGSAAVFLPYNSNPEIFEAMREATRKIAREFHILGFLNIQFAVKDNVLYVIDVNPRASRDGQ